MCTNGKPLAATRALEAGIIDAIVSDDLAQDARAFALARAAAHETRRTRDIAIPPSESPAGIDACRAMRETIGNAAGGAAARAAVDAVEAALTLSFDDGSIRERELFAACVVSTESKALRHLFFAEREAAKVPGGLPPATPVLDISRAAVVGAGTMGGGIAMAYAGAGIPVLLKDVDEPAIERGMATIRRNYESAVARGRLTPDAAARLLSLITPTTSYAGFETVDVVVEAVFEHMDLKKRTFAELASVTRPECLLASNTSTLDIDEFARASGRPGQVVGHHFFSPANVMKLVEVVRAKQTSPSVLATSVRLARRLGKVPVVVGNCFGFVANRMLSYYLREAHLLLEEGASVEQIDGVMSAFGMPVGPFGMQDIAGIDVGARIRQYVASLGRPHAEGPQSEIPDRLFAMGRFGQKTSAGWYRYEPGSRHGITDPLIHDLAQQAAVKRGITRRAIDDDEVLARITTALANEGMNVLEQGFALRAGDIDVVYCYGFGFPRWRGGPMFFAQTIGLRTVLARVEEYRARFGDHWEPAPLLQKYVEKDRTLFD
jgi:3-hydroxyacyl-CoA dehydrogenase